jgi:FkbM family methyltransferase
MLEPENSGERSTIEISNPSSQQEGPWRNMVSLQRVHNFFRKTPQQMWATARFMTALWLAKLPYAPHIVHLRVAPQEQVNFWWSYFPASFCVERSIFEYWGDDIGDLRFLWKHLQPGMTFLDIGAYHGIYSIIAARKLGSAGRIVAFEPSPRDRSRLQLHLRYNRIKSVTLEPYALAAEEGKARLNIVLNGYTNMSSLRLPSVGHPVKKIEVDTTSLDGYLDRKHIDTVDLMKIDVEGGEAETFRGADRLLSRLRPSIICEVLDRVTRPWGYPACEIISLLRTYDYEWFDILSDGSLTPHLPRMEYPEVRNYLAVPREKRDREL